MIESDARSPRLCPQHFVKLAWWHRLVIPALGSGGRRISLGHLEYTEFKASLAYTRPRPKKEAGGEGPCSWAILSLGHPNQLKIHPFLSAFMTFVPSPPHTSVYPIVKCQVASSLAVCRLGRVKGLAERLDNGAIRRLGSRTK